MDRGMPAPESSSLLEVAVGNNGVALHAAEPSDGKLIALARYGDGPIGAPAAFLRLTFGYGFKKKSIRLARARPGKPAGAVEIRVSRFRPARIDHELDLIG